MRWNTRSNATIEQEPRYVDPAQRSVPRDGPLTRFLGGSPLAVLLRLAIISILVGALMAWLNVRPQDVVDNVRRFVERFWGLGFDAVREAGQYLLIGAVIVVPVFLVSRLLGGRRSR